MKRLLLCTALLTTLPSLSLPTVSIALGVATLASPAHAEIRPKPGPNDHRVRFIDYRAEDVIRLDVVLKFVTSIEFEQGETVQSILVGDSESFEVKPLQNRNVVWIKPRVSGANTCLQIYTTKRSYTFDLVSYERSRTR